MCPSPKLLGSPLSDNVVPPAQEAAVHQAMVVQALLAAFAANKAIVDESTARIAVNEVTAE